MDRMTGCRPAPGGRKTSARRTRPSPLGTGPAGSKRIPSRAALTSPLPAAVIDAEARDDVLAVDGRVVLEDLDRVLHVRREQDPVAGADEACLAHLAPAVEGRRPRRRLGAGSRPRHLAEDDDLEVLEDPERVLGAGPDQDGGARADEA